MAQTTNYEITTDIESSQAPTIAPVEVGTPTIGSHALNMDYLDSIEAGKKNNSTGSDPGAGDDSDDGYAVGSFWINTTSGVTFRCVDASAGAAVWIEVVDATHSQSIGGAKTFTDTTDSSSKDTGSVILEGGMGVEKSVNVGGDLTVDGNFTVNKNGNDASSEGSGLTVERTGTDGSIVYEDALTSKFKCGALGSEKEILQKDGSQVVTNKDIDGGTASNTNRITVPKGTYAALLALTRKEGTVVYATDVKKFYYDNGTTLLEAGGGGQGGINYIENYDAELNTDDWTVYRNTTDGDTPDDFGGTPNGDFTWTRITSGQLRGDGSFRLTKTANNRQGHGIYYQFELADIDLARQLTASLEVLTSANYADEDIRVFLVTSNVSNFASGININYFVPDEILAGKGSFLSYVQTHATDKYARLCIHFATTNANALTADFDTITFGPSNIQYGQPLTDWESYTPSFQGLGTVTGIDFKYRRVGNILEVRGFFNPGSSTSAEAQATLPPGLVIDPDIGPSGQPVACGEFAQSAASATQYNVIATGGDTFFNFSKQEAARDYLSPINGDVFVSTPRNCSFIAWVPIKGWGVTKQLANVENQRLIDIFYRGNNGESLTANVTKIVWDTKIRDSHGAWDGEKFTAPYKCTVNVTGVVRTDVVSSGYDAFIGNTRHLGGISRDTESVVSPISFTVTLEKGEELNIRSIANIQLSDNDTYHWIKIVSFQGNQQAMLGEKIFCHAYGNSSSSTSLGDFRFENVALDSHGAWDNVNMRYILPETGVYRYSITAVKTAVTNSEHFAYVKKNGTNQENGFRAEYVSANERYAVLNGIISGNKGDFISSALDEAGGQYTSKANNFFIEKI